MKKFDIMMLSVLTLCACQHNVTYDLTKTEFCTVQNNQIICPDSDIQELANTITNFNLAVSIVSISTHNDGFIFCEIDTTQQFDTCKDQNQKLITGTLKNYEPECGYLMSVAEYKNGKMVSRKDYNKEGDLTTEQYGNLLKSYHNGHLSYTSETIDNKTIITHYDENNNITETETYIRDEYGSITIQ